MSVRRSPEVECEYIRRRARCVVARSHLTARMFHRDSHRCGPTTRAMAYGHTSAPLPPVPLCGPPVACCGDDQDLPASHVCAPMRTAIRKTVIALSLSYRSLREDASEMTYPPGRFRSQCTPPSVPVTLQLAHCRNWKVDLNISIGKMCALGSKRYGRPLALGIERPLPSARAGYARLKYSCADLYGPTTNVRFAPQVGRSMRLCCCPKADADHDKRRSSLRHKTTRGRCRLSSPRPRTEASLSRRCVRQAPISPWRGRWETAGCRNRSAAVGSSGTASR